MSAHVFLVSFYPADDAGASDIWVTAWIDPAWWTCLLNGMTIPSFVVASLFLFIVLSKTQFLVRMEIRGRLYIPMYEARNAFDLYLFIRKL